MGKFPHRNIPFQFDIILSHIQKQVKKILKPQQSFNSDCLDRTHFLAAKTANAFPEMNRCLSMNNLYCVRRTAFGAFSAAHADLLVDFRYRPQDSVYNFLHRSAYPLWDFRHEINLCGFRKLKRLYHRQFSIHGKILDKSHFLGNMQHGHLCRRKTNPCGCGKIQGKNVF